MNWPVHRKKRAQHHKTIIIKPRGDLIASCLFASWLLDDDDGTAQHKNDWPFMGIRSTRAGNRETTEIGLINVWWNTNTANVSHELSFCEQIWRGKICHKNASANYPRENCINFAVPENGDRTQKKSFHYFELPFEGAWRKSCLRETMLCFFVPWNVAERLCDAFCWSQQDPFCWLLSSSDAALRFLSFLLRGILDELLVSADCRLEMHRTFDGNYLTARKCSILSVWMVEYLKVLTVSSSWESEVP